MIRAKNFGQIFNKIVILYVLLKKSNKEMYNSFVNLFY
jgi:hypothetical protein